VTDAIEAIGVPHPEADVILINRRTEDFAYRLSDGDDVAVHPAFRAIDLAGLRHAGADPSQPVRFVLDAHLGKLASFLRLSDFDAVLSADDADVTSTAPRESRVARTRDVRLTDDRATDSGATIPSTIRTEPLIRVALPDCPRRPRRL
jgi:hypothetical protein